jgi:hypothetical protein
VPEAVVVAVGEGPVISLVTEGAVTWAALNLPGKSADSSGRAGLRSGRAGLCVRRAAAPSACG